MEPPAGKPPVQQKKEPKETFQTSQGAIGTPADFIQKHPHIREVLQI